MGVDGIEERLGQFDGVDLSRPDPAPQVAGRHVKPACRHHPPLPVALRRYRPARPWTIPLAAPYLGPMDADVIIVGGGLNGPCLGLALAQAGLSAVVVDARQHERAARGFDGRAYSLARGSQRLLGGIGVWPRVAAQAQPILQIKASDGVPGHGAAPWFLHFDGAELDDGPMGAMVEDRHLSAALRQAMADQPGLRLMAGRAVVAQAPGSVTLDDGTVMTARVVAGCDGRASGTASRAGITRTGWAYGQTALVCAVRHDRPHQGIAHQLFTPGGPFAILPLPGGHHSSVVWSEADDTAAAVQGLDDAGYLAALRPRFGDFLGDIALEGARFTYPLSLSLADRWVAERLVLVGDAAHGVHPVAGQGLNLGLRDVGALAEVLVTASRRGEDIGAADVLARYQAWRRFDTTALALGMDAVNRLFSNANPILRGLRDVGMGIVTRLPRLRQGFMRQAAGLTGPLPRLMQGLPL
jgi:2-octaprenyl-6-methoxyphenol hydroxylase